VMRSDVSMQYAVEVNCMFKRDSVSKYRRSIEKLLPKGAAVHQIK